MKKSFTYTLMSIFMAITTFVVNPLSSWAYQTTESPHQTDGTVNVGIMLPLHNENGDGNRMVEYYRGMLLGINQLKEEGMNINVHAWNVNADTDPRTTLLQEGASSCNIIFGPLYSKQVHTIADFCKAYNIQMVIPFSIQSNEVDSNHNIWQVFESPEELTEVTISHAVDMFKDFHPIFVNCNDTTSKKGPFTMALRKAFEANGIQCGITNVITTDEQFSKQFSSQKPNLVILNSARSPQMRQVMDKLDKLTTARKDLIISLLGYTEWLMYTKYNKARFAKYNTYIPSYFFFNNESAKTQKFITDFRNSYNLEPMTSLPQFAVTGYDHAMYFIGKKFSWLQSPMKFVKTPNGGYRNKAFMFIHYKNDGSIDAVQY